MGNQEHGTRIIGRIHCIKPSLEDLSIDDDTDVFLDILMETPIFLIKLWKIAETNAIGYVSLTGIEKYNLWNIEELVKSTDNIWLTKEEITGISFVFETKII